MLSQSLEFLIGAKLIWFCSSRADNNGQMEACACSFALICRQQWVLKQHDSVFPEDSRDEETQEKRNRKGSRGEQQPLYLASQNETAVPLVGMWIVNVMFV